MIQRPPPPRLGALAYGCYEDMVATLEKALTPGPYILGAQFTAADVYIYSQIGLGMMMKALEPPPVFQEERIRVRRRADHRQFIEETEELSAPFVSAT